MVVLSSAFFFVIYCIGISRASNITNIGNFTFTWSNGSNILLRPNETSSITEEVDCFGLGTTLARGLEWFFKSKANGSQALDIRFYLSSRNIRQRGEVMLGKQFGLEWVDFKIERRTVLIVHGFLSESREPWIKQMEDAFIFWGDVNVIIVDWSAGGNTWNYYKAVVNTRIVGYRISRFLSQLVNATINSHSSNDINWGPLYLVGHSLGAHICGFAANQFAKLKTKWMIQRITGLDPAQPCFRSTDSSMHLDKTDAPFVDIIHTNGRLLFHLGLGLPHAIGHVDFYPNGGMKQPGCFTASSSYFNFLPKSKIEQTICSHGRSYLYLTESLMSAESNNCTFWGHHWDLTYRGALQAAGKTCNVSACIEMGINADKYPHRGSFFVHTASQPPFCVGDIAKEFNLKTHLLDDLATELKD